LNEYIVQYSVQYQSSQHNVEPPLHFSYRCEYRKIDLQKQIAHQKRYTPLQYSSRIAEFFSKKHLCQSFSKTPQKYARDNSSDEHIFYEKMFRFLNFSFFFLCVHLRKYGKNKCKYRANHHKWNSDQTQVITIISRRLRIQEIENHLHIDLPDQCRHLSSEKYKKTVFEKRFKKRCIPKNTFFSEIWEVIFADEKIPTHENSDIYSQDPTPRIVDNMTDLRKRSKKYKPYHKHHTNKFTEFLDKSILYCKEEITRYLQNIVSKKEKCKYSYHLGSLRIFKKRCRNKICSIPKHEKKNYSRHTLQ